MIDMLKFDIEFDWTVKDLIEKIMQKWPQFLNNTLQSFGKKRLWEVKQDENKATYCQKIEKEDWEINPYKDSIQKVYNKYRWYYIRPKIFFQNLSNQKRVIIENLKLDQKLFESEKNKPLFIENELNKCVLDISLKPEWKKIMNRQSFKSGYLKNSK
jgi:methionyl-tRNA formyltransferase